MYRERSPTDRRSRCLQVIVLGRTERTCRVSFVRKEEGVSRGFQRYGGRDDSGRSVRVSDPSVESDGRRLGGFVSVHRRRTEEERMSRRTRSPGDVISEIRSSGEYLTTDFLSDHVSGFSRVSCVDHVVLDVHCHGRNTSDSSNLSSQIRLDLESWIRGSSESRDRFSGGELISLRSLRHDEPFPRLDVSLRR